MAQFNWSGVPAKSRDAVAARRMSSEAATLIGESGFALDEAREAGLAELFSLANSTTVAEALLNQVRAQLLYNVMGNPGFVIDTNFDVKNGTAVYYTNAGTLKTLGANSSFDTGTTKTITASKYGAAVLSVNASGTGTVTWAAGGGYDSEALAIAALTDPGATHTIAGYFSVQAHASGFTAGTDALTGGSGGNVATATTYYNAINPNALRLGAVVS
jgi:hypothetical protein